MCSAAVRPPARRRRRVPRPEVARPGCGPFAPSGAGPSGAGFAPLAASSRSRRSSARIALSSRSAWSQPQMWRVPCVARRRSSSAGDQRTLPVWPPRPDSAWSMARSTEIAMSPRCVRDPGIGSGPGGATSSASLMRSWPGCGGNDARQEHRKRENVGRAVLAEMRAVQLAELLVVGQDHRERDGLGRAGRLQRASDRPSEPRVREDLPGPGPANDVDPTGAEVDRPATVAVTVAADHPTHFLRPRPGASRARRPCSAGRPPAGGTSRGAARRTPPGPG